MIPRFLTVKISVQEMSLYVTCCHLDHAREERRVKELTNMESELAGIFEAKVYQMWAGDFNSLTKEDYSVERWDDITFY